MLVATAAWSVFGTQAHQRSSPAALAVVAAIAAFAGTMLAVGLPRVKAGRIGDWLPPLLAGAGGFAVAPWIVMANRYTDAPPGSEVLFFTAVSWGAMLAIALALASRERITRTGGTLVAVAGAALMLANWERPSSFSPLVRYAREEFMMLAAGLLWVALVLVLLRASRRGTLGVSSLAAALGGLAGAAVIAAVALRSGSLVEAHFAGGGPLGFGAAMVFAVAGMLVVLRSGRAEPIAAAHLLVPAAVSLLIIPEWALGPFGPQPMLLGAVVAGAVAVVAGIALLWPAGDRSDDRAPARPPALRWVATVVALAALAAAVVALSQPSMSALVRGLRADGSQFRATFDLFGYEVAGPWLAFGIAVAALGVAFERSGRGLPWLRSVALAAAVGAWWSAGMTPLRTLTSFIPSDVQVDYGSEFARIDFSGDPSVWALAAVGGALVAVALTWVGRACARFTGNSPALAAVSGGAERRSRGDRS
ncbi:MAG: hypothetical protein JXP37_05755 [Coriobacteriia bacterium]|nr:hypothetical protein [Coriobacteriia bacterium]